LNKLMKSLFVGLVAFAIGGCSTGDLRMLNDALYEATTGNVLVFDDQRDSEYIDDVKVVTGVSNGNGFMYFDNTSDNNYCRVWALFEDGSQRAFNLDPNEDTGSMYVDLYNQIDEVTALCEDSRDVFDFDFEF